MAIFEVRLRARETGRWNLLKQRETLAGDCTRIRNGENMLSLAGIVSARAGLQQIQLPEMIRLSPKLSIMREEVTVGLFARVMQGYVFEGHNSNYLQTILADSSETNNALTYASLLDAREFARRLSGITDRQFRVQTEDEWLTAENQLSGGNWTWTETKYSQNTYVLRCLNFANRSINYPESRYFNFAVRLVEDK